VKLKLSGWLLFVFLEKPWYEVCLIRIKEQVGCKRSTVCTHMYADCRYLHLLFNLSIFVFHMYTTYIKVWREYSTGMYIRDVLCLPHGVPASIWLFGLNSFHCSGMVSFIDVNFFYENPFSIFNLKKRKINSILQIVYTIKGS